MDNIFENTKRDLESEKLEVRRIERAFAKKAPAVEIEDRCLIVNPNNPKFLKKYGQTQEELETARKLIVVVEEIINTTISEEIEKINEAYEINNDLLFIHSFKTSLKIPLITNFLILEEINNSKDPFDLCNDLLKGTTGIKKISIEDVKKENRTTRYYLIFNEVLSQSLEEFDNLITDMNSYYQALNNKPWIRIRFNKELSTFQIEGRIIDKISTAILNEGTFNYQLLLDLEKKEIDQNADPDTNILRKHNIKFVPLSSETILNINKRIFSLLKKNRKKVKKIIEELEGDFETLFKNLSEKIEEDKKTSIDKIITAFNERFGQKGISSLIIGNKKTLRVLIKTTNEKQELTEEDLEIASDEADYFGINPKPKLTFELAKEE